MADVAGPLCLPQNTHHIMDAAVPFGGYKQSGIGREHGAAVLEHYTQASTARCARSASLAIAHVIAV